jgi:hypothetical protein
MGHGTWDIIDELINFYRYKVTEGKILPDHVPKIRFPYYSKGHKKSSAIRLGQVTNPIRNSIKEIIIKSNFTGLCPMSRFNPNESKGHGT